MEQRNRGLCLYGGAAAIVLLACAAILLWLRFRPPVRADLREYATAYRDVNGLIAVSLDGDALLKDLHLPSPKDDEQALQKYPDVAALLGVTFNARETETGGVQITVIADTDTLAAYGIVIEPSAWEQPLSDRGAPSAQKEQIAQAVLTPEPVSTELIQTGGPFAPTPTPNADGPISPFPTKNGTILAGQPAANGTLLTSLVDENGCGYNLRAVCERVQQERDALFLVRYGETGSYQFEKTQVTFGYSGTQNCYQASYRAWADVEGGKESLSVYFRIRIYGLTAENGVVSFRGPVDASQRRSDADAKQSPFENAVVLSGGGMRVEGRAAFDQNGFVLFPDSPTSYRMANGVYWSPTYDALDENRIWSLTAVEGHSLANLLRYARKEIYARYYAGFDEKSEREFYEHYTQYGWYHELTPDRTGDMTETERANIRLLREIQSLVEK